MPDFDFILGNLQIDEDEFVRRVLNAIPIDERRYVTDTIIEFMKTEFRGLDPDQSPEELIDYYGRFFREVNLNNLNENQILFLLSLDAERSMFSHMLADAIRDTGYYANFDYLADDYPTVTIDNVDYTLNKAIAYFVAVGHNFIGEGEEDNPDVENMRRAFFLRHAYKLLGSQDAVILDGPDFQMPSDREVLNLFAELIANGNIEVTGNEDEDDKSLIRFYNLEGEGEFEEDDEQINQLQRVDYDDLAESLTLMLRPDLPLFDEQFVDDVDDDEFRDGFGVEGGQYPRQNF